MLLVRIPNLHSPGPTVGCLLSESSSSTSPVTCASRRPRRSMHQSPKSPSRRNSNPSPPPPPLQQQQLIRSSCIHAEPTKHLRNTSQAHKKGVIQKVVRWPDATCTSGPKKRLATRRLTRAIATPQKPLHSPHAECAMASQLTLPRGDAILSSLSLSPVLGMRQPHAHHAS
jgi:hypothetical protein